MSISVLALGIVGLSFAWGWLVGFTGLRLQKAKAALRTQQTPR